MTKNCGISFGLNFPGVELMVGLVLAGLTVGVISWWVKGRRVPFGWGLVLWGGWGNFAQRWGGGCVIDNLMVPFLPLRNNFFDWLIFGGLIAVVLEEIWRK